MCALETTCPEAFIPSMASDMIRQSLGHLHQLCNAFCLRLQTFALVKCDLLRLLLCAPPLLSRLVGLSELQLEHRELGSNHKNFRTTAMESLLSAFPLSCFPLSKDQNRPPPPVSCMLRMKIFLVVLAPVTHSKIKMPYEVRRLGPHYKL